MPTKPLALDHVNIYVRNAERSLPDGNGLEVYYELPRSEWHRDRPFSGEGGKGRFPGPWDEALRAETSASAA